MSAKHEERHAQRRPVGMVGDGENESRYWVEKYVLSWLALALLLLVLFWAAVDGSAPDPDSYDWVMGHLSHVRPFADSPRVG